MQIFHNICNKYSLSFFFPPTWQQDGYWRHICVSESTGLENKRQGNWEEAQYTLQKRPADKRKEKVSTLYYLSTANLQRCHGEKNNWFNDLCSQISSFCLQISGCFSPQHFYIIVRAAGLPSPHAINLSYSVCLCKFWYVVPCMGLRLHQPRRPLSPPNSHLSILIGAAAPSAAVQSVRTNVIKACSACSLGSCYLQLATVSLVALICEILECYWD